MKPCSGKYDNTNASKCWQSPVSASSLCEQQAQVIIKTPAVSAKCRQSIANICQRLSEIAGDCWRLLEIAGDSWRLPEIAGDCWRLPEIAGDCRRLPEIAGNYWRMLVVGAEWWQMPENSKDCMCLSELLTELTKNFINCQRLPKFPEISRDCGRLLEIARECLFVGAEWWQMPEIAKDCRCLSELLKELAKISKNCRRLPENVDSCHGVMTYAGECRRMPVFAGITDTSWPVCKGEVSGTPILAHWHHIWCQDISLSLPLLAYSFRLNTVYSEHQTVILWKFQPCWAIPSSNFFLVFGPGLGEIYIERLVTLNEIRLVSTQGRDLEHQFSPDLLSLWPFSCLSWFMFRLHTKQSFLWKFQPYWAIPSLFRSSSELLYWLAVVRDYHCLNYCLHVSLFRCQRVSEENISNKVPLYLQFTLYDQLAVAYRSFFAPAHW